MMDMAVFDTNILIDFSRQNSDAQAIIRKVPNRFISIITWVEFLVGVPHSQTETGKAFLEDMFEIIETERSTYEIALDLRRQHRLKLPDALIYATAKEMSAPLVTRDTKDFDSEEKDIYVPY